MSVFRGLITTDQFIIVFLVVRLILGYPGIFADTFLHSVREHIHFFHKPLAFILKVCCGAYLLSYQPDVFQHIRFALQQLVHPLDESLFYFRLRQMWRSAFLGSGKLVVTLVYYPPVFIIAVPNLGTEPMTTRPTLDAIGEYGGPAVPASPRLLLRRSISACTKSNVAGGIIASWFPVT